MTRPGLLAAVAASLAAAAAQAAERAAAEVTCAPAEQRLTYDCAIMLADARTAAPLEGIEVTVGADMPSMPMAHSVRPVTAAPGQEPGVYHARITLEMPGEWALRLDLAGALRDRVVVVVDFVEGEGHRMTGSRRSVPPAHGHTE